MISYDVLIQSLQSCKTDVELIRNISITIATYIDCIQNYLQETSEKLLSTKEDQRESFLSNLNEFFEKLSSFLQELSQKKDGLLDLTETVDARHDDVLKSISGYKDKRNSSKISNTSNDTEEVKDDENKSLLEVFKKVSWCYDLEEKPDLLKITIEPNEINQENVHDEIVEVNKKSSRGKRLGVKPKKISKKSKKEMPLKSSKKKEIKGAKRRKTVRLKKQQKYAKNQESKDDSNASSLNEELLKAVSVDEVKDEAKEDHFCEKCISHKGYSDSFPTKAKLDSHKSQIHGEVRYRKEKSFHCKVCGRGFHYKHAFQRHENTAHTAEAQQRVVCNICGKDYSNRKCMIEHRRIHSEATHLCPICGRGFARKASLNMHVHSHNEALIYQCPECPKAFPHKTILALHARCHRSKEVSCELCGKNFSRVDHLKRHMYSHTQERKVSCHICNKLFKGSMHLRAHLKMHANERKHKCQYCGKGFNQSGNLAVHERIHTGERKFKCVYCEKAFVKKENLTRHERIHTGEKPYSCDFCGMKFNQSASRNLHMKRHKVEEISHPLETAAELQSNIFMGTAAELQSNISMETAAELQSNIAMETAAELQSNVSI